MDSEVEAILEEMSLIKKRVRAAVNELGEEGVKWKPDIPEANSAAQIVNHMFGGERGAVHGRIGGVIVQRDRDREFSDPVSSVNGLIDIVDKAEAGTRTVLENETSEGLARQVPSNQAGATTSAQKTLVHVVAHQAEHLGHLELTLQLWKQR